MKESKKIQIKICSRPTDSLLARLFGVKHFFILDEYDNIYEFSGHKEWTRRVTKWYLEYSPNEIKIKNLKVNRKLFYKVVRIQSRISKRRSYSVLKYNCHTYVNSILINLNKF